MKFTSARCEMCRGYFFHPEDVVAFLLRTHGPGTTPDLEEVELGDREPWAGVRCVCRRCARHLGLRAGTPAVACLVEAAKRAISWIARNTPMVDSAQSIFGGIADEADWVRSGLCRAIGEVERQLKQTGSDLTVAQLKAFKPDERPLDELRAIRGLLEKIVRHTRKDHCPDCGHRMTFITATSEQGARRLQEAGLPGDFCPHCESGLADRAASAILGAKS